MEQGKRYCHNCFHPIGYKAKFCAHCGQHDTDGKITMTELLRRFWNNAFHLESKFLRMVWQLLIPGKVTVEYFKGKHKRYPHPVQYFVMCMFFLLLMIGQRSKGREFTNFNLIAGLSNHNAEYEKGQIELLEDLHKNLDSLPPDLRGTRQIETLDSLLHFTAQKRDLETIGKDSFSLFHLPGFQTPEMAYKDAIRMEPDSLISYYHIDGSLHRLLMKQIVKASKNGKDLFHFYIGASTWTLLMVIALMSFWLMLLFRKQQKMYVEHFVFLLHFHSGGLFLTTIALFFKHYFDFRLFPPVWILYWLFFGFFIALKRFYAQGWFKTILKGLFFNMVYLISFVVILVFSFLLCLLIF